jgi:hypothetical protein
MCAPNPGCHDVIPAFVLTGVLAAALTGALTLLVLGATKTYRKTGKRQDARWRSEKGSHRARAAHRLGRFGSTRSEPYLSWQRTDLHYEVLDAAAGALSHDRGPAAVGPALDAVERRRVARGVVSGAPLELPRSYDQALAAARQARRTSTRRRAAQVIGRGEDRAGETLVARPRDAEPEAQRDSALALARLDETPSEAGFELRRLVDLATLYEPTPLGALRTAPVTPPLEDGTLEPPHPAQDAPESPVEWPTDVSAPRPRRARRWDARRLYTSAICREFIDGLSDDVLERSEQLFRALWRIGHVDSEQLADLLGCTPTSLGGLLMTPLSRRAKDLGLPLPYVVARAPNGRRIWREQGNVASRMTIAIQQEISSRADA